MSFLQQLKQQAQVVQSQRGAEVQNLEQNAHDTDVDIARLDDLSKAIVGLPSSWG
jgi:hypothetical protein